MVSALCLPPKYSANCLFLRPLSLEKNGHSVYYLDMLLRISNKEQPFFLLDQLSITLICVPGYDLSYNVYLFPYWLVIGYFSVTTRI